jgi:hypothetical protein
MRSGRCSDRRGLRVPCQRLRRWQGAQRQRDKPEFFRHQLRDCAAHIDDLESRNASEHRDGYDSPAGHDDPGIQVELPCARRRIHRQDRGDPYRLRDCDRRRDRLA